MTMYGLYVRDIAAGDLVWFTTGKPLEAGAYRRGRDRGGVPDIYLAESIPALVLQVGRIIDRSEDLAQSSLATPGTPANVKRRIESEMTGGLLQSLTETSSIWVSDPRWVDELRPMPE